MLIVILILLGLCFGSFVNAFVWRIYKQSKQKKVSAKYSITKGRSMCVNCGHTLSALDLVPVVSWLWLKGKCRYCHKKISAQYPLVELVTAGLFVASYLFWPENLTGLEWIVFGLWLVCLVGLVSLMVYDIRWMLLPNKIVFGLYYLAGSFVLIRLLQDFSWSIVLQTVGSVVVGGGIFYLLFQISAGKWIGGGDVKLGFLLGALIGNVQGAFLMLFLSSLLGCIYILPGMLMGKITKKTRIPFGPFLILATIVVVLFGSSLINWYYDKLLMV